MSRNDIIELFKDELEKYKKDYFDLIKEHNKLKEDINDVLKIMHENITDDPSNKHIWKEAKLLLKHTLDIP